MLEFRVKVRAGLPKLQVAIEPADPLAIPLAFPPVSIRLADELCCLLARVKLGNFLRAFSPVMLEVGFRDIEANGAILAELCNVERIAVRSNCLCSTKPNFKAEVFIDDLDVVHLLFSS